MRVTWPSSNSQTKVGLSLMALSPFSNRSSSVIEDAATFLHELRCAVRGTPFRISALTRLKSHWNLILAAVNGKQVCAKMWLGCFS